MQSVLFARPACKEDRQAITADLWSACHGQHHSQALLVQTLSRESLCPRPGLEPDHLFSPLWREQSFLSNQELKQTNKK